MPKYRTPKKSRTTYIYRDAYGNRVDELQPGENGVTADWIIKLHELDDETHNAEKRHSYHSRQLPEIHQPDSTNPETIYIQKLESAAFKESWDSLTEKQRELILKKLLKRTNVDIADEEGCTETAIRKRLKKIKRIFTN